MRPSFARFDAREDSALLDDLVALERLAASETRRDRAFLTKALWEEDDDDDALETTLTPTTRPKEIKTAKLAGTWDVCQDEDEMDFFSGTPGKGRVIFLWCRRFGTGPKQIPEPPASDSSSSSSPE